ncbi:hypothetical protein EVJ29_13345 [Exiguobacterium sp. SH4S7]|uniref:hypothetical protein n=1 Tax=Exiguobacterium sp. SH4S7 TaxID=2510958 RepID=UPI00103FBE53|nr:hypothetical protein [Exiguobacterium sp. SH4S7]TCI33867.1 hypothetical protein EVJ29_13345 [Exiguobacterium sp. SH4S7]
MDAYNFLGRKLFQMHEIFFEYLMERESEDEVEKRLKNLQEKDQNYNDIRLENLPGRNNSERKVPLLKLYDSQKYGEFVIEFKSYTGLIAKKAVKSLDSKIKDTFKELEGISDFNDRKKKINALYKFKSNKEMHGLFDFYLIPGQRYNSIFYGGKATHYNLFCDLKNHATLQDCERVWRGEDVYTDEENVDKKEVLIVLSILMFEQEINYGKRRFQQFTYFSEKDGYRPRDMIMGFLNMMYEGEEDYNSYPFWNRSNGDKSSPNFGYEKGEGFPNLELRFKRYFEVYKNQDDNVKSIFYNDVMLENLNKQLSKAQTNTLLPKFDFEL